MEEIIEKAVELLQPITFEPHYPGYFVKMNGKDLGGSDYCENCIKAAVKEAREFHLRQRAEIIKKHEKALKSGKYNPVDVARSKRSGLKEYPSKASFSYEGHDPDFGGGLHEPCTCEGCGEPFVCAFEPDKEEAEHLLRIVQNGPLSDREKWELDVAFCHFQYCDEEVQQILIEVANQNTIRSYRISGWGVKRNKNNFKRRYK